ncbi:MAG: MFS transporter [Patescibacteria group bacterium]|nr:MFS transporter [Patescibacteria group bacterium]MDE2588228.1 MFS transporter [Patescibacteria group bacterium]
MNRFFALYTLHFLNDGFESSFLLLLPFISKELHINLAQIGLLGTLEHGMEIFVALPAGYFALKFGGFRLLVYSLAVYSIAFIFTGITPGFLLLFVTYALGGAGYGTLSAVGYSLVSKWGHNSEKGKQLGTYSSMGDIGKAGISSLLPSLVTFIGWRISALFYGMVGLLVFIFFQPHVAEIHSSENVKKKVKQIPLLHILQNGRFIFANCANLFDTLASSALFIFFPFLLIKKGVFPTELGLFIFAYFLGTFGGKATLGRLSDLYRHTTVLIFSEILMGIAILILANTSFFPVMLVVSFLLGIFSKGTVPVIKTMISDSVSHHGNYEKAFSFNVFIASIASTISPLLWGFASYRFGITTAFNISAVITMITVIPTFGYIMSRKK